MAVLWSPESGPSARNDVERDIGGLIQEAINHVEHTLTPERAEATDYYFGRPFGNEEEGRSQIVMTTVRDTIQGMLPSLLRMFLGSERTVEFRARGPEDEPIAQQMTDYVNFIIREDNDGFTQFNAAFLDSLIKRLGVFKWWWEEIERTTGHSYKGLTAEELEAIYTDPTVDDVDVTSQDEVTGLYDCEVTRKFDESCAKFEAVPPEEFLFTPTARCLEDAILVAHRREMRRSELVAMGISEKALDEIGAYEDSIEQNEEFQARQQDGYDAGSWESESFDPKYLYVEAYVQKGGSWRRYDCLGSAFWIQNGKNGEPVDCPPFSALPCIMEPHAVIGQSVADLTKDLQRLDSAVTRGTVDSLGNAIMPRTAVNEHEVNMQDVKNIEVGGIIRTRSIPSNAIMEFRHNFVGSDTLPFLNYLQEVRENRTGQTKAAAGLDADALQSSTKAAVAATLTASQQRIEMIARTFAETGIKGLFQGLLKLVVEHQDKARVVRLRNTWVEVDPRSWNSNMDVSIHVGLGVGMPEEKMAMLQAIMEKQEQIMAQAGPVNPLVDLTQYRNTLTRMVELAGFADPDEFFKPIDPQMLQQMTQAASEDQPDPAQMLAQVQIKQIEADMAAKQAELQMKQQQAMMEDDRERDKAAADFALKAAELEMKYQTQVDVAQLKADAEQVRQETYNLG